jgi:hypothetical protein
MNVWIMLPLIAGFSLAAGIFLIAVYNRMIELGTNCENAFAQIETQLKRRYDLIPNLVECVKSYMAHEKSTLEGVIAARNQAAAGLKAAAEQPQNTEALQTWIGAETALNGALGRLTAVIESYPTPSLARRTTTGSPASMPIARPSPTVSSPACSALAATASTSSSPKAKSSPKPRASRSPDPRSGRIKAIPPCANTTSSAPMRAA